MHKRKKDCIFDPYRAIACAVLDQAVIDLRHYRKDPVRALDASVFLVTEGAEFASIGGLPVSEEYWEEILVRLV
jgi:hypothetical protein